MRKLLVLGAFIFCTVLGYSQVDLKVNPINALFDKYSINAEYLLNDHVGLELGIDLINQSFTLTVNGTTTESSKRTGFGADISYNYYFNPDKDCSKFYAFPYLSFKTRNWEHGTDASGERTKIKLTNLGLGGGAGYKWVSSGNVLFDLAFGIGKDLVNNYSYENTDGVDTKSLELSGGLDFYGKMAIGYRF